jgi:hypothetical protein
MSFDFNKKGLKYKFEAFASDKTNFGVLGENAFTYFCELQKIISETHQHGNVTQKRSMVGAQGCLERLEAFLVQSKRLSEHNQSVFNHPAPPSGGMAAFRDTTAIFDFETLLFHSKALLDRITFFIAKQIYNQNCDKPNKIKNVLNDFIEKDERASRAIQIIDEAMPIFCGLIVDAENEVKSLRSHLIHKSTSGESTTCVFTIHSTPENKVIRFDYEIKGYPIIGSAWELSKYIPFISLNLLGIYVGYDIVIASNECIPIWKNNLKCFSHFIDESARGPRFSIIKMHPSGFEINTRHLKRSILS